MWSANLMQCPARRTASWKSSGWVRKNRRCLAGTHWSRNSATSGQLMTNPSALASVTMTVDLPECVGASDEGSPHAVGVVDDHEFRCRCWGGRGCDHLEDAASDGLVLVDRDGSWSHVEDSKAEFAQGVWFHGLPDDENPVLEKKGAVSGDPRIGSLGCCCDGDAWANVAERAGC
eukprot:51030-Rhodomonas_salina.1